MTRQCWAILSIAFVLQGGFVSPARAAGEADDDHYHGKRFRYPKAENGGAIVFPHIETRTSSTKDDFETVAKHYARVLQKEMPANAQHHRLDKIVMEKLSGTVMIGLRTFIVGTSSGGTRSVMFVHCDKGYTVAIAITREKDDKMTQIGIVFRETDTPVKKPTVRPGDPPPPSRTRPPG